MGSAQIFWISEVNRVKKGDWRAFESYCLHPTTGSFFIFEAEELPASHPLVGLVKRFGNQIHLKSEGGESGLEALRQKLKRAGKTITPGGWQMLEERLSGSLRFMDLALDRLILYADGSTIDERAVEKISGEFMRYDAFELVEAFAAKNLPRALVIFRYLNDLSGDIQSVIGLIHWQLKRIWRAKNLLAQGVSPQEVGRALRIPSFRLGSFLSQVKRFETGSVEELIRKLWKIDWEVKTGACDDVVAVETFLAGVN
jgi:DNA polymerase-3 subunit delta